MLLLIYVKVNKLMTIQIKQQDTQESGSRGSSGQERNNTGHRTKPHRMKDNFCQKDNFLSDLTLCGGLRDLKGPYFIAQAVRPG